MISRSLRWCGGALVASAGIVLAAMACGPGDLHYLTAGDGAATEPPPPDPTDLCKHARPPSKPSAAIGNETVPQLVFAADDLRIDTAGGDGVLAPPASLDLDNTCSCAYDAGSSCVLPKSLTTGQLVPTPCDGDGGRDNVTGPLIEFAAAILPLLRPTYLRERIERGAYSVLVTLSGWNGKDDDDLVAVGIFMSAGLDGPRPPKFDGTDVWTVEQGSVSNGANLVDQPCTGGFACIPVASDLKAWVSGGTIVANFDEIPFAFGPGTARVSIPFRSATLTAKLEKSQVGGNTVYRSQGEIAGRWAAEDIINAVGRISADDDEDAGLGVKSICENAEVFNGFKRSVCDAVDLAARKEDDGKGVKCTTMSEAVRFTAIQVAGLGTIRASGSNSGEGKCPNIDPSCGF